LSSFEKSVTFKLLGLIEVNGSFLVWSFALTYSFVIVFNMLKPFDIDHRIQASTVATDV
jgi:hypothetical protein